MSITIQTRFAVDRNQNRKIEPDEIVKFAELSALDENKDQILEGTELTGIHYEYGKDVWAPADAPHVEAEQGVACTIKVQRIRLEDGGLDLNINCNYFPRLA
ncbi:MAG: hypothetical protein HYU64_03215 [Armatimonadetes bacterium]|nr:hypothetical protein [Armatimonadota bacterium]